RVPRTCHGRRVEILVVDDGSTDRSAAEAAAAGAQDLPLTGNQGLGAAVRHGLTAASLRSPAAVVYLDADGEYFPEDIPAVVAPVLDGSADYVVGTRFRGNVLRMLPHRRLGNIVLTRWVRWLTRRRDVTDGQSGFRAFSPAAAAGAEIVHDYNYAQVLTLDLLAKGFVYAEAPITYAFRETGTSFVRLDRYLRRVVPAVHRELNKPAVDNSTRMSEV
ncbi:MAG: glycosyltransferase family 2 protein, partial [Actinomycetes bacterium]